MKRRKESKRGPYRWILAMLMLVLLIGLALLIWGPKAGPGVTWISYVKAV